MLNLVTSSDVHKDTTRSDLVIPVLQREKLSINLTLYEAYTNYCTNLKGGETKRKKEFNLEAWEKETSNTIS